MRISSSAAGSCPCDSCTAAGFRWSLGSPLLPILCTFSCPSSWSKTGPAQSPCFPLCYFQLCVTSKSCLHLLSWGCVTAVHPKCEKRRGAAGQAAQRRCVPGAGAYSVECEACDCAAAGVESMGAAARCSHPKGTYWNKAVCERQRACVGRWRVCLCNRWRVYLIAGVCVAQLRRRWRQCDSMRGRSCSQQRIMPAAASNRQRWQSTRKSRQRGHKKTTRLSLSGGLVAGWPPAISRCVSRRQYSATTA